MPSHATIATFRFDPVHELKQRLALERTVVPRIRVALDVDAGTWNLDRERSELVVAITWDSRVGAEAMVAQLHADAEAPWAPGVELIDVRLLEVVTTT